MHYIYMIILGYFKYKPLPKPLASLLGPITPATPVAARRFGQRPRAHLQLVLGPTSKSTGESSVSRKHIFGAPFSDK